jgi:hypothetical protein
MPARFTGLDTTVNNAFVAHTEEIVKGRNIWAPYLWRQWRYRYYECQWQRAP